MNCKTTNLNVLFICLIAFIFNTTAQETLASFGPKKTASVHNIEATPISVNSSLSKNLQDYYFQVIGFTETNINHAYKSNHYFEWSITAETGHSMIIEKLELLLTIDKDKAKDAGTIVLKSSADDYSSTLYAKRFTGSQKHSITLDTPIVATGETITFRLYGYKFDNSWYAAITEDGSLGNDISGGITIARILGKIDQTETAVSKEDLLASYGPVIAESVTKTTASPISPSASLSNSSNNYYLGISGFTGNTEYEAVANDQYIEWSIGVDAGYSIDLTKMQFYFAVPDNSGPADFSLRSSLDNFSSSLYKLGAYKGNRIHEVDLPEGTKIENGTITFRMYIYNFKKKWSQYIYQQSYNSLEEGVNPGITVLQLWGILDLATNDKPQTKDILITEIMKNTTAVPQKNGEYIELFNNSEYEVNLEGWSLEDLDGEKHTIANQGKGLVIPAKDFIVLGRSSSLNTSGGVALDYSYGNAFILDDTDDEIILKDNRGATIDQVLYTSLNWENNADTAMVFIGRPSEDNDDSNLWANASISTSINDTMFGSPGANGAEQFLTKDFDYIFESGSWSPNVPPSSVNTKNMLIKDGNLEIDAPLDIARLQIRSAASVDLVEKLTINESLIVKGTLTFIEENNHLGELGPFPATAAYDGMVTVQSLITGRRSYRMVTSAVTTTTTIFDNWQNGGAELEEVGTHITGAKGEVGEISPEGFDYTTTGNASMYTVNTAQQKYNLLPNTTESTLAAGMPYLMFIRGDRTINLRSNSSAPKTTKLIATGALKRGRVVQSREAVSSPDGNDFAMFGNPYQSVINMAKVFENSGTSNLSPSYIYIYDPMLAERGAFTTVLLGTRILATGGSLANQYIQPGQGFQLKIKNGNQPSILTFEEDDKVSGNRILFKSKQDRGDNPAIFVDLYKKEKYEADDRAQDGFILQFGENFSNALNSQDANKIINFDESVYIDHPDGDLAIEQRELPKNDERIQLATKGLRAKAYILNIEVNGLNHLDVYLEDAFTATRIKLEDGKNVVQVNLSSDEASAATDRFSFYFEGNSLSVANTNFLKTSVFPNPVKNEDVKVTSTLLANKEVSVQVTDLLGRIVLADTFQFEDTQLTIPTKEWLDIGIYILTISDGTHTDTHKIAKE